MKRYLLSIFAASLALFSCVQNPDLEIEENPESGNVEVAVPETMDLSISAGHATKSVIDNDAKIRWVSGDQISVVFTHPEKTASVSSDFRAEFEGGPAEKATFRGTFNAEVNSEAGYYENGFAIYPHTAVDNKGKFVFELPTVQTAMAGGSFQSGFNLASASLSLEDVEDGGATADFKNALTFLRFKLDDAVKGIKFTGTSPLSGGAPLKVYFCEDPDDLEQVKNHGRLQIIADAEWPNESYDVTLMPEEVDGNFQSGRSHWYYLLVWPGEHSSLNITLDYGEPYGTYVLTNNFGGNTQAFQANKYYNLNFPSDLETIMSNVEKKIVITEGHLTDIDKDLGGLEGTVDSLLNQVQSISLMTDYMDNAAYAPYSKFGSSNVKQDIELSYMIRPVAVAQQLVEKYSEALSAVVTYPGSAEYTTLPVNGASISGDVMTVTFEADGISNDFYSGGKSARLALQISSGKSELLSDFANLYPKIGASLDFTKSKDIPVLKGATVSIPFKYAPNGDSYTLSSPNEREKRVQIVNHQGLYSGVVNVNISDSDLASQSVTVVLTSGDEVIEEVLTFAEGPQFEIQDIPMIDCIGGYFSINVNADWTAYNEQSYSLHVEGGTHNNGYNFYTWIEEAASGVSGTYSVEENVTITQDKLDSKGQVVYEKDANENNVPAKVTLHDGTQRQATAVFEVKIKDTGRNGDLSYRMTRPIIQKAAGTPYNPDLYYKDADKLTLQTASAGYTPLNIVILGDGYKKKDLIKGGLFEIRARSAMGSFFGIEPYKYYQNRFNVYMVAYESVDEGTDRKDNNGNITTQKNTYFDTYHKPQTELWLGQGGEKVKNIVTDVVKADIYRTIAIVLVNTDENAGTSSQLNLVQDAGATSYYGEPYKGFGVACVAANSTGTGGLIKHEAGGHAFGRLGDEYLDGDDSIVKAYEGDLTDAHNKGQYRNLTTYKGYWDDLMKYPGYSSVIGYVDGGMSCDKGIYRPTTGGMMFNNSGEFNAVCRRIIYERIIRQTEGAGAYSLDKFVEYDTINMPK